jgi:hypothetical protein
MATIAQMRARMNSGHRRVLESLRDGTPLVVARISDARGFATCRATLVGWGAIQDGKITEIGRALLGEQVVPA